MRLLKPAGAPWRTRRGRRNAAAVAALTLAVAAAGASPAAAFTDGQSSDARPGISYAGGTLYVGFAGTDSSRKVNIGALSFDSSEAFNGWASVNTISGTSTYPGTGVALGSATVSGYSGAQVFAAWAASNGQINFAHYVGTTSLSCWNALPEYSWHSPYLVGVGSTVYLVWTGTDSAHHINVMKIPTSGCPTSLKGTVVTLTDTTSAGPAITTDGTNLFVAWPGTDSAQHIYAGRYTGATSLSNHTCFCSYASADDLGLSINYSLTGELTYRGTDNSVYLMTVSLTGSGISASGQVRDGGFTTAHGVDIADVPVGVGIPSGAYDSFTNAANGQPTFDPI